jgi:glycosyltransferase involved in cell wall biosynthesis
LRETRFDIVHCHSGTFPYALVPLVADPKTSVRLHSLYCPLGAKGGVYSKWWETATVARVAFKRLDRVIAATGNVFRSLEHIGLRTEKIELGPMCVDTQRFRPRPHPEATGYFPNDAAQSRLLFIGNASQEKGLVKLLHAVKVLVEKNLRVSVVAAVENQSGIKEYEARYARAQEFIRSHGLTDRVRLVGLVDAVEELYAEADVLVIPWRTSRGPSDYPMVVLEAMAMGKCVVSTPVGGCPELLAGQAGLLTDDFSVESIASALELVSRDHPMRKRVEATALQKVQELSVRSSADRLMNLYEDLLHKRIARYARCPV